MIEQLRWLIGYLTISVSGEYTSFLDRMAHNGITVWALTPSGGNLTARCSVRSFKRCRILSRNSTYKIHIIDRGGAQFFFRRYRFRYGLAAGALLYASLLIYLSGFIWTIRVEGNANVSSKSILQVCDEYGVFVGKSKSKINTETVAQKLPLRLHGLSFSALNIENCVLTAAVSEILPNQKETVEPGNLVAVQDGIIQKCVVHTGTLNVQKGSAVKKGDLLVSGVSDCGTYTIFEKADGHIFAEVTDSYTARIPVMMTKNTDETETVKSFMFFHCRIPLNFGAEKMTNSKTDEEYLSLFGKKMPVGIIKTEFVYPYQRKVEINAAKARKILQKQLRERLSAEKIKNYKIVEKHFDSAENYYSLTWTITHTADIAEFRKINIDTAN